MAVRPKLLYSLTIYGEGVGFTQEDHAKRSDDLLTRSIPCVTERCSAFAKTHTLINLTTPEIQTHRLSCILWIGCFIYRDESLPTERLLSTVRNLKWWRELAMQVIGRRILVGKCTMLPRTNGTAFYYITMHPNPGLASRRESFSNHTKKNTWSLADDNSSAVLTSMAPQRVLML